MFHERPFARFWSIIHLVALSHFYPSYSIVDTLEVKPIQERFVHQKNKGGEMHSFLKKRCSSMLRLCLLDY